MVIGCFTVIAIFSNGGGWGYVMLSELEGITLPFGLKIEREKYVTGGKVKDYI